MAKASKFLAALFASTLTLSVLAACSSEEESSETQSSTAETSAADSSVALDQNGSIEDLEVDPDATADELMFPFADTLDENPELAEAESAVMVLARENDNNVYIYTAEGVRSLVPDIEDPAGFPFDRVSSELTSMLLWVTPETFVVDNETPLVDNATLAAFEFPEGITQDQLGAALRTELATFDGGDAAFEPLEDYEGFRMTGSYTVSELVMDVVGYYWIGNDGTTLYQLVLGAATGSVPDSLDAWARDVIASAQ